MADMEERDTVIVFREGLTGKEGFEQRLEEDERKSPVGICGESVLGRGNGKRTDLKAGLWLSC